MAINRSPVRDWVAAAELIRRTWQQNRETPIDYTPEFFNSLLEYPGIGPVVAPGYYYDGKLFAFIAGFPRVVSIRCRSQKLLLVSFFTVAPEYQGRGYGRTVFQECLQQAKSAGYDGVIHYCVDGNPSNTIMASAAKSAGFETLHVFTVKYLMRRLRP